jgi:hypothetical protein
MEDNIVGGKSFGIPQFIISMSNSYNSIKFGYDLRVKFFLFNFYNFHLMMKCLPLIKLWIFVHENKLLFFIWFGLIMGDGKHSRKIKFNIEIDLLNEIIISLGVFSKIVSNRWQGDNK